MQPPAQPQARGPVDGNWRGNYGERRGGPGDAGAVQPGVTGGNRPDGVGRSPGGRDGDGRRFDRDGPRPDRPDGGPRPGFAGRPGWDGQRDGYRGLETDRRQGFDTARGADGRRFDDGRGFDDRRGGPGRPGFADRPYDGARQGYRGWNGNDGRAGAGGAWARDWRGDRRYDWRGYRDAHRGQFRVPRYVPPRGYAYGYRSFSIGLRLDPFLYGQGYWLNDPWEYRLPPADGPYRWVRYYDDVLLVDIRSGTVVDVIRDFFF